MEQVKNCEGRCQNFFFGAGVKKVSLGMDGKGSNFQLVVVNFLAVGYLREHRGEGE